MQEKFIPKAGRIRQCLFLAVCLAVFAAGCASAKLNEARDQFYGGNAAQAAGTLSQPEDLAKRDRLLYYMEKGLILYEAGDYAQSAETLLDAVQFIKDEETLSVSREGGSLVTSERLTVYRGEYAERLLIHTYLMMNYLLLDYPDDAYVEARQALQVIDEYPTACQKDFFTRGLIAHCFEAAGDINGAYIEYRKLASDMPDPAPVIPRLFRLARNLGFSDDAEEYAKKLTENEKHTGPPAAEAVIFVAQGRGPVKEPRNIVLPPSIRFSFVEYVDRNSFYSPIGIESLRGPVSAPQITTDVTDVLENSLSERAARIIAKETARAATKEVIAQQIDDPMVELLVRVAFFLAEEPDTRGWETLPGYLTLISVPLEKSVNSLKVTDIHGDDPLPPISVTDKRRFYYFTVRSG